MASGKRKASGDAQFKSGSMTKVSMHNFLTYEHMSMKLGPKLNMVVGPNGTGKSSIVCAMALALGATAKTLGRADDLGAFVMRGKQNAWCEVELLCDDKDTKLVLRRSFKASDKRSSEWTINGRKVKEQDIKQCTGDLGIQVCNLCTFLPQDRVGDFSSYNPKEIFKETALAVSEKDLYGPYLELLTIEKGLGNTEGERTRISAELDACKSKNDGIKREVDRMKGRQTMIDRIDLLQKRKAWVKVAEKSALGLALKAAVSDLKAKKEEADAELKPLVQQVEKSAKEVQMRKTAVENCKKAISKLEQEWERLQDEDQKWTESEQNATQGYTNVASQRQTKQQKLDMAKEQKKVMQNRLREMMEQSGDPVESERRRQELQVEMGKLDNTLADRDDEDRKIKVQIREADHDFNRAKRAVAELKKDTVFTKNPNNRDSLMIRKYISDNPGLFQNRVYGPVAMEVTATRPEYISILENRVGVNIWKAFVTTCEADRKALYAHIETTQMRQMIVNVEGGVLKPLRDQPFTGDNWERVKNEFGATCYVDEIFQAPDAVREAIRSHNGVHGVLIGEQDFENSLSGERDAMSQLIKRATNGRNQVDVYTISKDRSGIAIQTYNAKISKYSNELTMSTNTIRNQNYFIGSADDPQATAEANAKVAECQANCEGLQKSLLARGQATQKIRFDREVLVKEYDHLRNLTESIKREEGKIKGAEAKIIRCQQELNAADTGRERANFAKKLITAVQHHGEVAKKMQTLFLEKNIEQPLAAVVARLEHEEWQRRHNKHVAAHKESLGDSKKVTEALDAEVRKLKAAKEEFKAAQAAARALVDVEKDEEMREKLDELPDVIEDLDEEIASLQQKVTEVRHNPEVVRLYEEGLAKEAELRKKLEALIEGFDEAKDRINKIRNPWKNEWKVTIDKLNDRFSKYMTEMGCGGEIVLDETAKLEDYGLNIQVRFRNKEVGGSDGELKTLDSHVHSGGERSVSTILYLMALQELQRSPFRVVDEINQGMDPNNERLVFSRIVINSCQQDSPQFFLITPKLLQGLTAMERQNVKVHFVHNGAYGMSGRSPPNLANIIAGKRGGGRLPVEDESNAKRQKAR